MDPGRGQLTCARCQDSGWFDSAPCSCAKGQVLYLPTKLKPYSPPAVQTEPVRKTAYRLVAKLIDQELEQLPREAGPLRVQLEQIRDSMAGAGAPWGPAP